MVVDVLRGWWLLQVLGQRCAAGSSVATTNWTCGAQRSNDRRRPRGWLLRFLRRRTRPAAVVLLPAHAATATAADTAALAVDVRRVRDGTSQQSTTPRIALHVTDTGCLVYLQVCAGVPTSLLPGAPQRLRNAGADVRLPAHAAAAAAVHGGAWQQGPSQSTPQCRRWWAPRPWHKRTCRRPRDGCFECWLGGPGLWWSR